MYLAVRRRGRHGDRAGGESASGIEHSGPRRKHNRKACRGRLKADAGVILLTGIVDVHAEEATGIIRNFKISARADKNTLAAVDAQR